jgi:hypothetical protein
VADEAAALAVLVHGPGGGIVRREGRLIRPFQDCTDGYGRRLTQAETTRLTDGTFAQQVDIVLRPGT